MSAVSKCGLLLPLPATFDFAAYMTRPADVASSLDLLEKNAENVRIEKANRASCTLTRAYQAAATSGAGVGSLDVGDKLCSFFAYSDEDKVLLVGDEKVVEATGPLPVAMQLWVAGERLKTAKAEAAEKAKRDKDRADKDRADKDRADKDRADKEAEKVKAARPIDGTMRMTAPHSISSVAAAAPSIPAVFKVSLFHKIFFPLHWWEDETLARAIGFPHSIPTEQITAVQTTVLVAPASVRVVNVSKALKELGEEQAQNLTPGLWRQASVNQLQALKPPCPSIVPGDPNPPGPTYASEYEKHVLFFANLNIFEKMFHVWYPVEFKLRYEVYKDGVFNLMTYETRLSTAVETYEQMRAAGLPFVQRPLAVPYASPSNKRLAADDGNDAPPKAPRARLPGPGAAARDYGNERGLGAGARQGPLPRGFRAPACIVCTGPHNAYDHPPAQKSFRDGA
ncbi:hypothetical protein C8R45DRAFT_231728 [Mycena sanguinolenta]|nr:hypothetical protein C8R45DRAFT_231728 [Mycena sanguinolenta]